MLHCTVLCKKVLHRTTLYFTGAEEGGHAAGEWTAEDVPDGWVPKARNAVRALMREECCELFCEPVTEEDVSGFFVDSLSDSWSILCSL